MSNNSNYKSKIQFKQQNCDKPHIYKITNLINNKYYYGVHDGSDTQNYEGSGKLLKQAYEKHGKENFIKEILMWFDTEDEAYEYEAVVVNEKMINKNNPMCYNLCVGGAGGDTFSCQTPERQEEIRQKCSGENNAMFGQNPLEGKSEKEIEEINQKKTDWYQNLSEEKKQDIKQKQIDFAKKQWENRTPEQKADVSQKRSCEKNGAHTQYLHPYNPDFIGNWRKISNDIRDNYPNEKSWHQISKKKKKKLKIKKEIGSSFDV